MDEDPLDRRDYGPTARQRGERSVADIVSVVTANFTRNVREKAKQRFYDLFRIPYTNYGSDQMPDYRRRKDVN